jgi:hypothetical protein
MKTEDGKGLMCYSKKIFTKEQAIKMSYFELDIPKDTKLKVEHGYVRHGFGKLDDEECKPYNNWWLQGINDDEINIVDIGKSKIPVWVVSVDDEMVGIEE